MEVKFEQTGMDFTGLFHQAIAIVQVDCAIWYYKAEPHNISAINVAWEQF